MVTHNKPVITPEKRKRNKNRKGKIEKAKARELAQKVA